MKPYHKIHYSKEEKIKILSDSLPYLLKREIKQITDAIDAFTFNDLRELAVLLRVFAQGKKK